MSSLTQAIGHLERGDWEAAHRIVQDDESPLACWAHGIVHLMEGDMANAGYWYRRAGRPLPAGKVVEDVDVAGEIVALKARSPP